METWASGIQEGEARQKPTSLNPRVHPHPHAGVENKDKCFKHNHMPGVDAVCACVRVCFCVACLCVYATSSDRAFDSGERLWKNSGLIMPLMIDGPDQLQEWLDWTWPRHNAFLACWKPTRNTEPECLSAALLAPLTEWCLLQCTTVLQEDYVRRSRIAGPKMCFSRNCFSLSKIPGQNFGAVSSAVAVHLCAHLRLSSLLLYPVSESEYSSVKKYPTSPSRTTMDALKKIASSTSY